MQAGPSATDAHDVLCLPIQLAGAEFGRRKTGELPGIVGASLRSFSRSRRLSKTFTQDFKRNFFRGLAAMLPTVLTLMIIIFAFQFIQKYVGQYLNVTAQWIVVQFRTFSSGRGISWRGDEAEWFNVENLWNANHLDLLVVWIHGLNHLSGMASLFSFVGCDATSRRWLR